jgi:ABC-type lipoprotein export system ATPase subunit
VTLLSLSSVSRSHWRGPSERKVLRDVSLDVRTGDLVAVYGQRGAGKTTLLKIAAGFDPPDTGKVLFEGIDLASLSRRELAGVHREWIGWVERSGPHSHDLPTSVYVALPLYGKVGAANAQRLATAALSRVGADDCADRCWDDLSDADRILVAIAHALVREPRLLVVDDPTAGLGIVDRERVVGLLRAAAEEAGIGVLMAVPDMPAMLHAHEVRSLSRGRLVAPADRTGRDGALIALPGRDLRA